MSDKKNENEESEENKNEGANLQRTELKEKKLFEGNFAKLYNIIYEIYRENKKVFIDQDFDLYSPFLNLLQPRVTYNVKTDENKITINDNTTEDIDLIKNKIISIMSEFGCKTYPTAVREKEYELEVNGLLYYCIQSYLSDYNEQRILLGDNIEPINGLNFFIGNIYFRLSSLRKCKDLKEHTSRGRITIHFNLSPTDFWKRDLLPKLIKLLIQYDFVTALKVRAVRSFGGGDSLLIYCSIPTVEAWQILKDGVLTILPEEIREKYTIPFAKSLDIGINGNIPIYYGSDANKFSFTEGLAKLSRDALIAALKDKDFKSHSIYDVKTKYYDIREKNISIFKNNLIGCFQRSGLEIDEDGALFQRYRRNRR